MGNNEKSDPNNNKSHTKKGRQIAHFEALWLGSAARARAAPHLEDGMRAEVRHPYLKHELRAE
eukprot:1595673-Amphidinium_carterae.2